MIISIWNIKRHRHVKGTIGRETGARWYNFERLPKSKIWTPNPLLMYSANVKDSENADR